MSADCVVCFHCNGRGEVYAHINYGTLRPAEWRWIRCQPCDGLGLVSLAYRRAWEEGTRRRELRVAAHVSQQNMAQRLGVTPQAYTRMECGREPWPEGSAVVFAALEENPYFTL